MAFAQRKPNQNNPGGRSLGYGRRKALYTCAEDACDPYEEGYTPPEADGAQKPERRHRAVRLMDAMDPPDTPREAPRQARRAESAADMVADRAPTDDFAVLSVTPEGAGETVLVVLRRPSPEGGFERLKLHLFTEQYAELDIRVGALEPDVADALVAAGRLCAAIKRGMNLLAYGDQSARRLAYKLTAKGVDRATAEEAARYLTEKGYIHEDDTARLRAEQGVRKLWGPRRIREDLRANGFTSEAVEEALETLREVNFEENCLALIRRKYGSVPEGRTEREKLVAALMRQGYDMDIIRAAMRRA